jgi:16S rRNA A1518/A1519 N6-dimethyltransferase RsmA/KsgA/DIM1 with predicted DNA glycosylase/AP lyase activity
MARQKLGQHFLQDGAWRRKIAATLPLAPGDTWIEIGAGHGEMTRSLAGDARRVVAIDTDASLAQRLAERVRENPTEWPGVTVVHGDVLTLDLADLARRTAVAHGDVQALDPSQLAEPADKVRVDGTVAHGDVPGLDPAQLAEPADKLRSYGNVEHGDVQALDPSQLDEPADKLRVDGTVAHGDEPALDRAQLTGPARKFRVYGNLPYYITSPILRHLFGWAERIASIHIVVQLEVAARIVARPGRREYGYLSALCQFYTKPEIVLRIPPGAFRPPPRVESALLRMNLPGERASLAITDEERFLALVQTCFGQKRKTLRNNLLSLAGDDRIRAALAACNLRPDARGEQLSLREFAALFEKLGSRSV